MLIGREVKIISGARVGDVGIIISELTPNGLGIAIGKNLLLKPLDELELLTPLDKETPQVTQDTTKLFG